jgi:hypothetical protein
VGDFWWGSLACTSSQGHRFSTPAAFVIRKRANLIYRRNHGLSPDDYEKALALVHTDLESSLITQWGYRSQNHLRIAHNPFVGQWTVNSILRELYPTVRPAHLVSLRYLRTNYPLEQPPQDITKRHILSVLGGTGRNSQIGLNGGGTYHYPKVGSHVADL